MSNQNKFSQEPFVSPRCQFSFVHVFTPIDYKGDQNFKYRATLCFPKSDQAAYDFITAKHKELIDFYYNGTFPQNQNWGGLIDGATDPTYKKDEYFHDKWVLSASQGDDRKVEVVDQNRNPIIDKSQFYSGCFGVAFINFFHFDGGKGGISCSLHSVMKLEDGEHLGGGPRSGVDAYAAAGYGSNAGTPPPTTAATQSAPPQGQTAPPPATQTPPPPAAPAAPPAKVMTPKANGTPYQAYVDAGWTDEQLIAEGLLSAA